MNIIKSLFLSLTVAAFIYSCKSNSEPVQEGSSNAKLTGTFATTGEVKWEAKGVGHGHNGTIEISKSEVTFAEGVLVGGMAEVDMKTIRATDLEGDSVQEHKLVGHLLNTDFFAVDSFPTASIKINSVTNNEASADLTMRGITNPIKFPVTIVEDSLGFTITSTFPVDRTLYNIKTGSGKFFDIKKLGDHMIEDIFNLSIKIQGAK
ncbi:MAG: YceI family protein [Chitinophagales bacterium]|nr:YceI family protein [Chitinophagales bacterium]